MKIGSATLCLPEQAATAFLKDHQNKQTNKNYDSSLGHATRFLFINISTTCWINTFEEFSPFF